MSDIVLGIRLTADGSGLVGEVKLSREELDKLKKSAEGANSATRSGADDNRRYGESLQSIGRFGALAGTAIVALAGALVLKTKNTIEAAAALGRMSEQTGHSVEWLQRMKYAEDQLGLSTGALIRSYQQLPRTLVEAMGPNSEAARALKALGIDPKQIRDIDQGMALIAERFRQVRDPMVQAAIAKMIFKERGEELLPYLKLGADGMRELHEEGGKYAHITKEGARQAEELRRQWSQLEVYGGQLSRMIQSDLLPPLNRYLSVILELQRAGVGLPGAINAAVNLSHFGATPGEQIKGIEAEMANRSKTFSGWLTPGPALAAVLGIGESNLQTALQAAKIAQRREALGIGRTAADGFRDETTRPGQGGIDATLASLGRESKAGGSRGGVTFEDLMAKNAAARQRMYDAAEREADRQAEALDKLARKFNDMADPIEPLRRELLELEKVYAAGKITSDAFAEATMNVQERIEKLTGASRPAVEASREQERARREGLEAEKRAWEEAQRKSIDESRALWSTVEQTGKQAFVALMGHGEGAARAIGRAIKVSIIDLLYQITARKWIINIGGSVAGSLGFSGVAAAAKAAGGGGGGLSDAFSMASGANTLFNSAGLGASLFGSSAAYASGLGLSSAAAGSQAAMLAAQTGQFGAAGLAATAEAAGASTAVGAAASGASAASTIIPVVGWAIAAYMAYNALKSKKTPAVGQWSRLPSAAVSYAGLTGSPEHQYNTGFAPSSAGWGAMTNTFAPEIQKIYQDLERIGQLLGRDTSGLRSATATISTGQYQFENPASALPEILTQLSDQLSKTLIPNLNEFAEANETATQTLLRMASEFQQRSVNEIFGLMGAAVQLQDQTRDLWLSDLSPLTAAQRLSTARGRYSETLGLAQGGDVAAMGNLAGISRTYLEEARGYYASSPAYTAIFNDAQASVQGLVTDTLTEQSIRFSEMGLTLKDIAVNTKDLDKRIADALQSAIDAWQAAQIEAQQAAANQISAAVTSIPPAVAAVANSAASAAFHDDGPEPYGTPGTEGFPITD